MQKDVTNELRIVLMSGRSVQFVPHELRGFFMSRQLALILLTILVLLIAVDPNVFPHPVNPIASIIFWVGGLFVYLSVMVMVGAMVAALAHLFEFRSIYLPLVDVPIVALSTISASYIGAYIATTGTAHLDLGFAAFVRNYLIAQGVEFIILNWAFVEYIRRRRERKFITPTTETSRPRERRALSANSRMILIDQLIYLKAKQHYVEIKTRTGTLTERTTLKALIGQLSEEDGIQIHRCYWVSSWAAERLSGSAGKRTVHLFDGTTLPVSRPRAVAVEEWFDTRTSMISSEPIEE